MRKKMICLTSVFVLSLLCTSYTSAGIVYVDAAGGEGGNTTLATGEIFEPVEVGSGGSGVDGLWRIRPDFANGGTIIESRGDWGADNSEDCPRLMTSVDVPEGDYKVYAYMWTAGGENYAEWRLGASLTDDANELPVYICGDPNGEATLAVAEDFEEPVPMLTESDRTMWQIPLGTTGVTTAITVYVDDDVLADPSVSAGGNARTWYDGIGYEPAEEAIEPINPGTEGLVAAYSMEGDVLDGSGNGYDGTIMGDPNFVDGIAGQALDLDGDGDYIDCGNDPNLGMLETNQVTVATWVTIRSIAHQWAAIAAKGEDSWRIGNASLDPRFHMGIAIWNAPDTASIDAVTAVGFDEWHHVVGMYDGASINVYLDGALDVSVPTTQPIGPDELPVLIGDNPGATGRYWDGLIDEVLIYNRALSDEEILFLAQ